MKTKLITWSVGLVCLLSTFGAGCGEPIEELASYMVFGTVTCSSRDVSSDWAYFRIVQADAAMDSQMLYRARCRMIGPSCDYLFTDVYEGLYTVYGMIDQDDDMDWSNPLPGVGDLVSPGRPLTVYGGLRMDFPDQSWREML